ncbi:Zn-dependent hydrolase [Psychromonas sp. SA13A]|uniref:Zn-dependent hydrolase n=1 Tax=Psychromonas sp. SA13A TaxID=2686346 RepID=UPI00140D159A|nr:Zn-dependent hydrolase [Psychromonas sp. SA13A]
MNNQAINQSRLWDSLMEMAKIGATEKGGCCRLALTDIDKQGRDLFISWCVEAGCSIHIDKMGNIFARREGRDANAAAIGTGSHLDTQPTGGKFDGIYGCLAGLEVIRSLNEQNITTNRPIEVSVWTNEEGSRFAPAMVSSGVYSGKFDLDYAHQQTDSEGITIGEALNAIGYMGDEEVGNRNLHKFFELHIEQGPVLEQEEKQVGIVTGVLGMRWYDVTLEGTSAHAGPTPMSYRKDALYAATQVFSELYQIAEAGEAGSARCTVGELNIIKGSRNVIPGEVTFTLDLRHAELAGLADLEDKAQQVIAKVAESTGVTIKLNNIWDSPPLAFNADCVAAVAKAVENSGLTYQRLVSGAGHDAVNISTVVPTSMIFIPSIGGISHNEAEYSSPDQVGDGCQILFDLLVNEANT